CSASIFSRRAVMRKSRQGFMCRWGRSNPASFGAWRARISAFSRARYENDIGDGHEGVAWKGNRTEGGPNIEREASMTSHEEIQLELAAYAASRLERDAGRRLEEHLRGCQDCREMLETFVPFARALGEGGEALFEPHPSESTLRRYARAGKAAGMEDVARHLDFCASCSLQVGAWKRQA